MSQDSQAQESSPLHPGLVEHRRQIDAVRERAHGLTDGLSDAQARWRPEPGRWSVIECLHHLNEVDERAVAGLRKAAERGRAAGKTLDDSDPEPFRRGFLVNLFCSYLEPPYRMKTKAPKLYASPPELHLSLADVMERFDRAHEAMGELIDGFRDLDWSAVKASSPVSKLIRFNLDEWYAFLMAHDRRHLWQAEQVRALEGFGGTP